MDRLRSLFSPSTPQERPQAWEPPPEPRRAGLRDLLGLAAKNAGKAYVSQFVSTGTMQTGRLLAQGVLMLTAAFGDDEGDFGYGIAAMASLSILAFDALVTSRAMDSVYSYCRRAPVHDGKGELIEHLPPESSVARRGCLTMVASVTGMTVMGLRMVQSVASAGQLTHVQDMRDLSDVTCLMSSARLGRLLRDFIQQYCGKWVEKLKPMQTDGKALPPDRLSKVEKRELVARFLLYAGFVAGGVVLTEFVMKPWLGAGKPEGNLQDMALGLVGPQIVSPIVEALDELSILLVQGISAAMHGHDLYIVPAKLAPDWQEAAVIHGGLRAGMGIGAGDVPQAARLDGDTAALIGQGVGTLAIALMEFRGWLASKGYEADTVRQREDKFNQVAFRSHLTSGRLYDGALSPLAGTPRKLIEQTMTSHGLTSTQVHEALMMQEKKGISTYLKAPVGEEYSLPDVSELDALAKFAQKLRALPKESWIRLNGDLARLQDVAQTGGDVMARASGYPVTGHVSDVQSFTRAVPGIEVNLLDPGMTVLLDGSPVVIKANRWHEWGGRELQFEPIQECTPAMRPDNQYASLEGGRLSAIIGSGEDNRIHELEGPQLGPQPVAGTPRRQIVRVHTDPQLMGTPRREHERAEPSVARERSDSDKDYGVD